MRKRKKIIRIKNPESYNIDRIPSEEDLAESLVYGDFISLTNLVNHVRQGSECEDCDKDYRDCECEYCEDCKQKRCVCFLKDLGITDETFQGRDNIRKIIWEFIRYNKYIYQEWNRQLILDYIRGMIFDLRENDYTFLLSITTKSQFPKYTSLMKRLFEID